MKCFIDTNSLIHYKMFSDIDWLEELSTSDVEIIICSTVLHELDHKKFAELDIDIRNRCKKIIAKLTEYSNSRVIRENVEIKFLSSEPKINWEKEGLSSNIPDDRIIASIIEYPEKDNLVLVTSDLGIRLKSQARNIKTHTFSDDLLIQVKKNKKENDLIKLRQRISFLENRFPKLTLKIIDNDSSSNFKKYTFDIIKPYNKSDSENIVNQLKDKLKYIPTKISSNSLTNPFSQFAVPSQAEIKRYEKEIDKYFMKLKQFYKNEWDYKDTLSRVFEINLLLINEGTEPANDIDIFLPFPDGFMMFKKDKYPRKPKKPEEPEKPRTLSEMVNDSMRLTIPSDLLRTHYFPPQSSIIPKGTNTSPNIRKTNSYEVRFKIDKLKHKMNIELDPLFIYFENYDFINSFSFRYNMLAGNNPESFEGELNIVFP